MNTPALADEIRDEFSDFFRRLGYWVTWDFQRRTGLHWYEIGDQDGIICQVDFGTPLQEFLADLPHFVEGKPGIGPTQYECRCPSAPKLRGILDKVRAAGAMTT